MGTLKSGILITTYISFIKEGSSSETIHP